jgi:hypothetical protein
MSASSEIEEEMEGQDSVGTEPVTEQPMREQRPRRTLSYVFGLDVLKGLISMTGLGAKKKRDRPRKTTTTKKGKGVLTSLIKTVVPAVIDTTAAAAKGKVSGMGAKRKPGRPRKVGRPEGPSKKRTMSPP